MTINDIKTAMRADGSHWWDPDTMRHFGCKVESPVYQGPGGVYFVTSEDNYNRTGRQFTVRQYQPACEFDTREATVRRGPEIETVGEYGEYASRGAARAVAKGLSKTPLEDQLIAALAKLDKALTGDCRTIDSHVTRYGSHEEIREAVDVVYLSDGGYTRLAVKGYEDGSGIYLQLLPTGSDPEEMRMRFADVYQLQEEIVRVLLTEPAGDAAENAERYLPVSDVEQLRDTLNAHGGDCDEQQARKLIAMATRAHIYAEMRCGDVRDCEQQQNRSQWAEQQWPKLKKQAVAMAKRVGATGVILSGDPRGCCLKLTLADGYTDDFGKEGLCVPVDRKKLDKKTADLEKAGLI